MELCQGFKYSSPGLINANARIGRNRAHLAMVPILNVEKTTFPLDLYLQASYLFSVRKTTYECGDLTLVTMVSSWKPISAVAGLLCV